MFDYILNERCRKCQHSVIDEEKGVFQCSKTGANIRDIEMYQADCLTYIHEHPEAIEEEKKRIEARDLLRVAAHRVFEVGRKVADEVYTTASSAEFIVKKHAGDLAEARNVISAILGVPKWHGVSEQPNLGEDKRVKLVIIQHAGEVWQIERTVFSLAGDWKWEIFVEENRVLYWMYAEELFETAKRESEAKNENH